MNLRKITALLLLLSCLALCACGQKAPENRDSVSLWALEGDALLSGLTALCRDYNQNTGGTLPVSLRLFPDEEALAQALQASRPDLLLCQQERAVQLQQRGLLRDAQLRDTALQERCSRQFPTVPGLGESLFPLGSRVQLLYCRGTDFDAAACPDLEALCYAAADHGAKTGLPLLSVDSCAALLNELLWAQGEEFHARRETDLQNAAYAEAYNLLAEAVFQNGLVLTEKDGVSLVQAGALPCALVDSAALAGRADPACSVCPLPGVDAPLASLSCLAVTAREGRALAPIRSFLSWLAAEDRIPRLALESGLVPALTPEGNADSGEFNALLLSLAEGSLRLPEAFSDYPANREAFELQFRRSMRALSQNVD